MDSDAVALTIFAKVLTNTNHREVAKLETKLSCKRKKHKHCVIDSGCMPKNNSLLFVRNRCNYGKQDTITMPILWEIQFR